nr:uncharacterized protein LOC117278161 isoform X1 [Nicotiana tomentosiformis]
MMIDNDDDSGLVARARASTEIWRTPEPVEVDTTPSRLDEEEKETSAQVPEPRRIEDALSRGKKTIEEMVDASIETGLEAPQDGGGAPKDPLGSIEIGDSPSFPSFSESMICDAQVVETCHGEGALGEKDTFSGYFVGVEGVTGLRDLEVPKKSLGKALSSFKLTNKFSGPSADPGCKRSIVITVPEDARVLAAPIGVASYLRCLVTEEDQDPMDEVGVPCLFNEAQQSLNRASVLHREAFFRSRGELSRCEVEILGLSEEKDAFNLLSEQREGEVRGLRAELEAAQKEQGDLAEQVKKIFEVNDTDSGMVANSSVPQVQQKLDMIGQLREEVDAVRAETVVWKNNMDRLASEKEVA